MSTSGFSIDSVVIVVPDSHTTSELSTFYSSMFGVDRATTDSEVASTPAREFLTASEWEELVGTSSFEPVHSPSPRIALAAITPGPSGVSAIVDAAAEAGAAIVKPAKKQLFGEFAASLRAPDGTTWKIAAASKKDVESPFGELTETAAYLAVSSPKASKDFYRALGMTAEHNYGDTFVDFTVGTHQSRLGLLQVKGLAKDLGVRAQGLGTEPPRVLLKHSADSRKAAEALATAAGVAGGRVLKVTESGSQYSVLVTDPDDHLLLITSE